MTHDADGRRARRERALGAVARPPPRAAVIVGILGSPPSGRASASRGSADANMNPANPPQDGQGRDGTRCRRTRPRWARAMGVQQQRQRDKTESSTKTRQLIGTRARSE